MYNYNNNNNDKSSLFQIVSWWRQETSHYLTQGQLRFMSPYGVTRPQWVNMKMLYNVVISYINHAMSTSVIS